MRDFLRLTIWQTGFRVFFAGAGIWAAISMALWLGVFRFNWQSEFSLGLLDLPASYWHAHEMIYGYAAAVIAGFLLTAVPNWTNTPFTRGRPVVAMVCLWGSARVLGVFGSESMLLAVVCLDTVFLAGLICLITPAILKHGAKRQLAVVTKIGLLALSNCLFAAGALGYVDNGMIMGLYSGFYLVIALILTLSRRVIPVFIASGLNLDTPVRNRSWVDIASLLLFLLFWVVTVFLNFPDISATLALLLVLVHSIRLYDWHVSSIWRWPLLWVLYLAYCFIVLGFAAIGLKLAGLNLPPSFAVHILAIGGIGLITCGMMCRVSLGHTGRDVRNPSKWLGVIFLLLVGAMVARSVMPVFDMSNYQNFMVAAQILWIAAFCGFLIVYLPILVSRRVDGKSG